jgi:hypothetical protein
MTFTHNDEDETHILDAIQNPVKCRLVELVFQYASAGPGLTEAEFKEIKEIVK